MNHIGNVAISIILLAACFQFHGITTTRTISLTPSIIAANPPPTSPYVTTFPISHNSSDFIPFVLDPASNKTVWLITIKQGNITNNVPQPPRAQIVNYTVGAGAKPVITLVGAIP